MSTTVLVVEDDIEINELLGEYLGLEDIKYLQATTGQEGINLARTEHPDAVVLDLMLPDIDGFEVARTLSTHRATYDIPIVILSCMCQDCDREKGYGAGALFYMNKPFLPDDLLATLRRALDWKSTLKTRPPMGTVMLGGKDRTVSAKAANQMYADLFAQTDMSDAVVGQIRDVVETLGQWTRKWNAEKNAGVPESELRMDYKINASGTGAEQVEWKLSETTPAILADAFFKPVTSGSGGGLMGWGGSSLVTKSLPAIAPPAAWLQVLAKTGAARFEKDSKSHSVRFTRVSGGAAPSLTTSVVPVVDIDGNRYPTRLRDEALAAKRK